MNMLTLCNAVLPVILGAKTEADFLNPIRLIINLLLGAVALWGIVNLIRSVNDFITAWKANDETGCSTAFKGIAGGLIQASIGALLTFLGITW